MNKDQKDISKWGYKDDSPYKDEPYLDIYTPDGIIDMTGVSIPLLANNVILQPNSGLHQFDTTMVREIPLAQDGTEINYSDYKYIPQEFFQVPEGEFEYDAGYWDEDANQFVRNIQTASIDPAWFTPGFEDSDVYKNYTRDQKRAYAQNPYTVYSDDGTIHPLLWDKERLAKENKLRFNAQLLTQIYDEEGNVRPEYQDRIGDKRYLTSTDTPYYDIPRHGEFSSNISNKNNWYSELKPNIYTEDDTVTGYLWNKDKGEFVRTSDVTYDQLVDQYKHIKHLPGMKGVSKRDYKKRLKQGDIFWPQLHSDEQKQGFEDQYSSVIHPIKPEDVELQKDFFNNAISGDLYRQKLINAGYENVDEIIEKRRKGLLDTDVRYDSQSDSWLDEASEMDDPNVYHKIIDKMALLGDAYKEAGIPINDISDIMYMSGDYTRIGDERSEIDQDYDKSEERRKSGQSYYTEPERTQLLYAQLGNFNSPAMKHAMRKILSGHLGSRAYTGSHGANFGQVALDPRQAQGINIDMGFEGTPAQLKSQMSSVTAHELAHMMGASHRDSDFGLNEQDQNYIANRMNIPENATDHDKSVFERKADLDAMRHDMMETIGYDYGKDMLTPEILEQYKQHVKDNPNPNLPRERMFKFFNDKDIIDINNAVAQNYEIGDDIGNPMEAKYGGSVKQSPYDKEKLALKNCDGIIADMMRNGAFLPKFKMGSEKKIETPQGNYTIKKDFDKGRNLPYINYRYKDIDDRIYYDKDDEDNSGNFQIIDVAQQIYDQKRAHELTKSLIKKYRDGEDLSYSALKHLSSLGLIPVEKVKDPKIEELKKPPPSNPEITFEDLNVSDNIKNVTVGDDDNVLSIEDQIALYMAHVSGAAEGTPYEKKLKRIYDKLNRVYYQDSKKAGLDTIEYMKSLTKS